MTDNVNHPEHYTSHPSGVECITITRHMSFNIGNAVKYLWRAGLKGAELEDLKKAAWYIADEIARIEKDAKDREPELPLKIRPECTEVIAPVMRAVGTGETSEPSCFGTPEVFSARSRAEKGCDYCGLAKGCYDKARGVR